MHKFAIVTKNPAAGGGGASVGTFLVSLSFRDSVYSDPCARERNGLFRLRKGGVLLYTLQRVARPQDVASPKW